MKDQSYYDYVRNFGFGEKTGIPLQGEISGLVNPPHRWDMLTKTRMAYGQSVAVTPIQMVMGMACVANGGRLMKPRLVQSRGEGSSVTQEPPVRRVVNEGTAKFVSSALEKVVSDQGTAPLARIEGFKVAGKTGTTEKYAGGGKYATSSHIASFCGFVPAANPRFTILVVLDQPERALFGAASANIFAEIATKFLTLYSVQPDQENYES